MILRRLFSRDWVLTTALVLVAGSLCARLGVWQLDRLAQRRAFNAHVMAMRALPPVVLPAKVDLTQLEYRAVRAAGTYDYVNEIAIRNQMHDNQYGYHLLTPLRIVDIATTPSETGVAVLIDRGWIPADGNSTPADWRRYDLAGPVVVNGVIRQNQLPPAFGGAAESTPAPGQNRLDFWIYINVERMGKQIPYPLLPIYVQLDPASGQSAVPIAGEAELDLSDGPHTGYAIQWFGFALALLVGYPVYVRKHESKGK